MSRDGRVQPAESVPLGSRHRLLVCIIPTGACLRLYSGVYLLRTPVVPLTRASAESGRQASSTSSSSSGGAAGSGEVAIPAGHRSQVTGHGSRVAGTRPGPLSECGVPATTARQQQRRLFTVLAAGPTGR